MDAEPVSGVLAGPAALGRAVYSRPEVHWARAARLRPEVVREPCEPRGGVHHRKAAGGTWERALGPLGRIYGCEVPGVHIRPECMALAHTRPESAVWRLHSGRVRDFRPHLPRVQVRRDTRSFPRLFVCVSLPVLLCARASLATPHMCDAFAETALLTHGTRWFVTSCKLFL